MKKISLLKSLAILGTVILTSVCVTETVLLLHKNSGPTNSDPINLNTYDAYTLASTPNHTPLENEAIDYLVNGGIKSGPTGQTIFPITDKEDIDVTILPSSRQILISAKNNSTSYVQGSHATISYALPTKQTLASIVGSDTISAYMDDKYDDEFTKAYILKSLQSQYPALNINHLDVTITSHAQENEGTAVVAVKAGSSLYEDSNAAVTYYTSGSVVMTLNKYLIKPGDTATASFKFRNATPPTDLTYTMPIAAQAETFTWTGSATGTLVYSTGNVADFAGGSYEIVGTYINGEKTYVARCIVYAQSNLVTGKLSVANNTISTATKNSGTSTYTVNGAVPSGGTLTYAITPSLTGTKNAEGLSFASGTITWDGTSPTNGGMYKITATYAGTSTKTSSAETFVTVMTNAQTYIKVPSTVVLNNNSGTPIMYANGATMSSVTWTLLNDIPANQGLRYDNGIITHDGSKNANGGTFILRGTCVLNGITLTAYGYITVAKIDVIREGLIVWNTATGTNGGILTGAGWSFVRQIGNVVSVEAHNVTIDMAKSQTVWQLKLTGVAPCNVSGATTAALTIVDWSAGKSAYLFDNEQDGTFGIMGGHLFTTANSGKVEIYGSYLTTSASIITA